ncbi:putative sugar transporter [Erysiphe necator]|uniref:Putative sugar transporter n=1 Tax=Uncinula necator TaxID=52586 RepID=A0A0B1P770_UNCNE|nr:putative sugar transporter [Erysiphe necator]
MMTEIFRNSAENFYCNSIKYISDLRPSLSTSVLAFYRDSEPEKTDARGQSLHHLKNSKEFPKDELILEIGISTLYKPYDKKCIIINRAIEDVGMGRYNWSLFVLCGFGWFTDLLWIQQVALTLPSLSTEFGVSENRVRYTTCYMFVGLCFGSIFWGVGSDIVGRKIAFNLTLLIAGIFGIAVGAAPTWTTVCVIYFGIAFGVGGNLPVDGALFLEFLPNASGRLLTLLSIWWPMGQLVSSVSSWGFIGGNFTSDKGWRYSCYLMGSVTLIMFLAQFFLFHLLESPKLLLARGRQAEAVAVVHGMAHKNRTTTWLTEEILNELGGYPEPNQPQLLTRKEMIRSKLSAFSFKRIRPLFATKGMARNTTMLWYCWLAIGMGYPLFNGFLPQYLSKGQKATGEVVSEYTTYRNYVIISIMGIPGSILAYYTVDLPYIGRRGTMIVSTFICGIMLFLFTISFQASFQLGISAVESLFQNVMYAVLYSYTPEVFPTSIRGTGTGIASLLNRVGGLCAPIIAANVPLENPNIPIFVSGSLILSAFVAMLFLTIETRGRRML